MAHTQIYYTNSARFASQLAPGSSHETINLLPSIWQGGGLKSITSIADVGDLYNTDSWIPQTRRQTGSIIYDTTTGKYYKDAGGIDSSSGYVELTVLNGGSVSFAGITSSAGILVNGGHIHVSTTNGTMSAPRITASTGFSGSGANIISINAGNISSGTLAIARGGTNNTQYTNRRFLVYDDGKISSSNYSHTSFATSYHNHSGVYLPIAGGILGGSLIIDNGGSLIQGDNCNVEAPWAHAQGQFTIAKAEFSHAQGLNTFADAEFSHAQGIGTTASGQGQLVVGRYNDPNPHHVFIIGCGADNERRGNAYYVSEGGENVFDTDVIFKSLIIAPLMYDGILAIESGRFFSQAKNSAYNKNFGDQSGEVCQGDDPRLSDARTPTSHTHGAITDVGAITTNATLDSGDKLIFSDYSDLSKLKRSTIAIGSDTTTYLRNDGTWETPPNTTYTAGTGLILSSTTFNHDVSNGFYHLPSSGTSGQILVHSGTAGSGSWASSVTSLTIGGANYSGSTFNIVGGEQKTASSVAISTYDGVFFDYKVKSFTNIRIGTVMACHDGTYVQYTQNSTMDLGNTSDIKFEVRKVGNNLSVIAINSGVNKYTIKSMIRAI